MEQGEFSMTRTEMGHMLAGLGGGRQSRHKPYNQDNLLFKL